MKNTFKLIGIIAIVAVIGLTGCAGMGSGGSGSGSAGTQFITTQSFEWPSSEDWARYDLSGLSLPTGATVTAVMIQGGQFIVALKAERTAFTALTREIERMSGWRLDNTRTAGREETVTFQYISGQTRRSAVVTFHTGDETIGINVTN